MMSFPAMTKRLPNVIDRIEELPQAKEGGVGTTVYVDVLVCVNFIVDYVMLLSVKRLLAFAVRRRRLVAGAAVGGLGSLVVLLPPMPFWGALVLSLAEAFLMVLAVFAPSAAVRLLKATLTLFAVSFLYSGMMTALLSVVSMRNLTVRNGVVYIGLSPLVLIALTGVCYGLFRLYDWLRAGRSAVPSGCQVHLEIDGHTLHLQGMIDTGHLLHEPFSGDCVIICRPEVCGIHGSEKEEVGYPVSDRKHFRMIPFSTVSGSGLLPAFRPDKLTLQMENRQRSVQAFVALSSQKEWPDGCDCLVPAELIRKGC